MCVHGMITAPLRRGRRFSVCRHTNEADVTHLSVKMVGDRCIFFAIVPGMTKNCLTAFMLLLHRLRGRGSSACGAGPVEAGAYLQLAMGIHVG